MLKKVMKKSLLTLLLSIILIFMFWQKNYNIWIFTITIFTIFMVWFFDANTISSLSFDLKQSKIEMNRNVETTKKIANEVEVTAKTFNKTIKAFMNFNLADLQLQGRVFVAIDWKDAAKFVEESIELNAIIGEMDEETSLLIMKSKCKVIDLFQIHANSFFKEAEIEINQYISCGFEMKNGLVSYDINNVAIDFDGLYNLVNQVPENNKLLWNKEVSELKKFYTNNF
ncbi:hypothetical protein [Enterococcus sp. DIV0546]|uniref:hypothetical protein n=1 Tax=Enterococcus sp. DIV0546 TaxID=2774716 RepID=UPI003F248D08